ncbi:ABC transporter permease [Caenispirillum bisanense]|uniref:Putative ABC transport system permease protein n=1 Tax=Caenispirillum bisanense TaxID=414052 RepID=A0A286H0Q7_9PROT|nr:ABC transporter permease [Caenispirillum bisanense]SOE01036.1 putative ABC transport system permease protein [Caenispirillum bisanense]
MTPGNGTLDWIDLAVSALLIVLAGGVSLAWGLGIHRRLGVAAVRSVVQLLLLALILEWLFAHASPWLTAGAAVLMLGFAAREIFGRQDRRLTGGWAWGAGGLAITLAASAVTLFALAGPVRPDPWYDPRYAIPLLGMILGNVMTGIAVGLNTLTATVARDRAAVEARLALGETRWSALGDTLRHALRTGLIGIINSMSAAGIVFIPGMMTGQILAGQPPEEAARWQILILFLIAGATAVGTVAAVMLAAWRLTDDRHRLRLDRLSDSR